MGIVSNESVRQHIRLVRLVSAQHSISIFILLHLPSIVAEPFDNVQSSGGKKALIRLSMSVDPIS